jgi:phospholipase DDHD1
MDKTTDEEQRKMLNDFHESRQKLLDSENHLRDILLNQDEHLSFNVRSLFLIVISNFQVKFLFCVGSPLAVFVVMRGHEASFIPDKSQCEQIVNIFHPYDPVAYRLEPLFHQNYKLIRPARVFSYSESNRDYDKVPLEMHKSYLKKIRKEAKKVRIGSDQKKIHLAKVFIEYSSITKFCFNAIFSLYLLEIFIIFNQN